MWRYARDAVADMLTACTELMTFTRDIEIAALARDTLRLRAVERSLAILGEAAKRVPADIRERHPAIPWRAISGLRDVLVHDYFGVDLGVVEQVIREEVPLLVEGLRRLMADEGWADVPPSNAPNVL